MPTPILKRDVILKTSVASATASNLTLSVDASFSTALTGTTITYEDDSVSGDEKTKYKLVFTNPGSASVGSITLNFVGAPAPAVGSTVAKVLANYTFDPSGTSGSVTLITAPAHSFERIWKQNVRDRQRNEVVDNIAKLEMAVDVTGSNSVTQTLTTATDNQLVISYSWLDAAGGPLVTGTVTLDSSAVAGSGYALGNIRITDTDSNASLALRGPEVGRGDKGNGDRGRDADGHPGRGHGRER